jgi:hypothetical protein
LAVARATALLQGHHSWDGKQAGRTTVSSGNSGILALQAHVISFAVSATTSLAFIITLLTRLGERFETVLAQQTPPTGDPAKAAETGQEAANMVPLDFVNELLDSTLAGGRSADLVKLLEARFAVSSTGCATDIPPLAAPRVDGDAGANLAPFDFVNDFDFVTELLECTLAGGRSAEMVKLLEARFAVPRMGCAAGIPPLAGPRDPEVSREGGDAGSPVCYAVGDAVWVVGLVTKTELNGAGATVIREAGPTGRYGVRVHLNYILDRQASEVEIKGCNLTTFMFGHRRV